MQHFHLDLSQVSQGDSIQNLTSNVSSKTCFSSSIFSLRKLPQYLWACSDKTWKSYVWQSFSRTVTIIPTTMQSSWPILESRNMLDSSTFYVSNIIPLIQVNVFLYWDYCNSILIGFQLSTLDLFSFFSLKTEWVSKN